MRRWARTLSFAAAVLTLAGLARAGDREVAQHVAGQLQASGQLRGYDIRVKFEDGTGFIVADIPGLVEGAHEGRGMGHEFLRHIERTKVIVYLLDASGEDPAGELDLLRRELRLHQAELLKRPSLVMLNKADLIPPGKRTSPSGLPDDSKWMSAATGEGVPRLLKKLGELVSST